MDRWWPWGSWDQRVGALEKTCSQSLDCFRDSLGEIRHTCKSLHLVPWKYYPLRKLSFLFLPSSSLEPMQLSLITCSHCMRKVGLWGFQQIESSIVDLDTSFVLTSSPIPGPEGRPERFLLVPESPRRMMTRSQDAASSPSSEQV